MCICKQNVNAFANYMRGIALVIKTKPSQTKSKAYGYLTMPPPIIAKKHPRIVGCPYTAFKRIVGIDFSLDPIVRVEFEFGWKIKGSMTQRANNT